MSSLFDGTIRRLRSVVNLKPVPVSNTSDALYAVDDEHHQWVRKSVEKTVYEPLLAEALAWLLARELQLPVPDAAVYGDGQELSWMSSVVPSIVHWKPDLVPFIENIDGLGRTLALDAVLLNADRHAGNVLLQPNPDQLRLRLWAIDFGDALVGHPDDFAGAGLDLPGMPSQNLMRGIPVDLLQEGAEKSARLAASLPSSVVRRYVQAACELAQERKVDVLEDAVLARLAIAPDLTDRYLASIKRRP